MAAASEKSMPERNRPDLRVISTDGAVVEDGQPELNRDASFWSMATTQFLGAFNDNLFKQLILLLATPTLVQVEQGLAVDLQSRAQYIFAAAFLLFSGVAGFLSDRYS